MDLSAALRSLRPVQHACDDPHFSTLARPVNSEWMYAGITGSMGGFNPLQHCHYFPSKSLFNKWLNAEDLSHISLEDTQRLTKEVLSFVHDYYHSWAYRALARIIPKFTTKTPATKSEIYEQAFFLILTEATAVVGLDYWYLSVKDIGQRCNADIDVGPCTVRYREALLPEYRKYNPNLNVQDPSFFVTISKLYTQGTISGFSEEDLLQSRTLANWLIRELLIAPRQREVSMIWLSSLSGIALTGEEYDVTWNDLFKRNEIYLQELAVLLWEKVIHGKQHFFSLPTSTQIWSFKSESHLDFRFANLSKVDDHLISWISQPDINECWNYYIDQILSTHEMPKSLESLKTLKDKIGSIKDNTDSKGLAELVEQLPKIESTDHAPLELLFVN